MEQDIVEWLEISAVGVGNMMQTPSIFMVDSVLMWPRSLATFRASSPLFSSLADWFCGQVHVVEYFHALHHVLAVYSFPFFSY